MEDDDIATSQCTILLNGSRAYQVPPGLALQSLESSVEEQYRGDIEGDGRICGGLI